MRITAITKFKHGALWAAIKSLGWSQSEFARHCGLTAQYAGEIINLQRKPTPQLADKIQLILGRHGVFIDPVSEWPESFVGRKDRIVVEQTKDIDQLEKIESAKIFHELPTLQAVNDETIMLENAIIDSLDILPDRYQSVVKARFGIGCDPMTYREIAENIGVSVERCRQIEKYALNRLRRSAYWNRSMIKKAIEA